LINNIFRIDPQSGQVVEYPIPFTTPISNQTIPGLNNKLIQDRTALSCAIRKGADGKIYFANGLRNQLGRIDPQTKNIQIFQPPVNPAGNLLNFNDLYTADDGIHFTQTTGNVFSFFSFATEQFSSYNVPTPLALPLGLFVASDKKVYIAELLANKILVFDPKTKAINEYALPELAQFPAVVRAERYRTRLLDCPLNVC
jgi:streptogramin lyase